MIRTDGCENWNKVLKHIILEFSLADGSENFCRNTPQTSCIVPIWSYILLPISAVGNHLLRQVLGKSLWKKSTGLLISDAILLLLQNGIASFLTILTVRYASAKGKNTVIPLRKVFFFTRMDKSLLRKRTSVFENNRNQCIKQYMNELNELSRSLIRHLANTFGPA